MKSLVLSEIGKIEYKEVKDPVLKSGECLIRPMAFGICGSDIPRIYKTGAHVHPIIPGHEFSGIVVETADGSSYKSGDRVAVFPLIPCKKCSQCLEKKYEMCENYLYLGSRCDGGFAELAAVPEANLIRIPENVSFEAAAMTEPMAVAVHAARRATVSKDKDSTIFVQGMGTVGLFTVIVLKTLEFNNIYVAGNSVVSYRTLKDKIKLPAYGKYLRRLMKENALEDKVTILGKLDSTAMKERYLKSSLFVCCSAIENSPNSLGEAMLLGMPCVTADVGGIPGIFDADKDGIMYEGTRCSENSFDGIDKDEEARLEKIAENLAAAVIRMWSDEEKESVYCINAREHALRDHDRQANYEQTVKVYEQIVGGA